MSAGNAMLIFSTLAIDASYLVGNSSNKSYYCPPAVAAAPHQACRSHLLGASSAENSAKLKLTFLYIAWIISMRGNLSLNGRNHRFVKVVDDRRLLRSAFAPRANEPLPHTTSIGAALHSHARRSFVPWDGQKSLQSRCS